MSTMIRNLIILKVSIRSHLILLSSKVRGSLNKFPGFFSHRQFYWEYTHENLVAFEVIFSGCNTLLVPFQQLLEGPMEVLLCERVNDLRHSLFHLLNCLITTASELRELAKVTGSKVWTIGRGMNCLDIHLGQIVCDKDGVVDWCIVLVEMPWLDLRSARLFRRNLFLNSLTTST